jgi:hypothetical protein
MLPHIIKEVSAKSDSDYHSAPENTGAELRCFRARKTFCEKIPRSFAARVFYT